ncbi:MAG: DUF2059 domain-containing protein [Candidatus Rokuibacteriota bacterium]
MKRALVAWVTVTVMVVAGPAAGAERAAGLARELYRLAAANGAEAIFEQMRTLTSASLTREFEGQLGERFSEDERRRFQTAVDRVLARHFSTRTFEDECVEIYARHFTADELEQMVAFYGSPVGRKSLELGAALASEMMAAGQRVGQGLARSRELHQQLLDEIRRALPHRFKSPDEEEG